MAQILYFLQVKKSVKGISALCGVVHEQMCCEIKNGDVFVFINKGRNLMKLL